MRKFEDHGEILKIEPERLLQYSHFSPLPGKEDRSENYHAVAIKLSGSGDDSIVSWSQDNNADEDERKESEKHWHTMLDGLKKQVEEQASITAGAVSLPARGARRAARAGSRRRRDSGGGLRRDR